MPTVLSKACFFTRGQRLPILFFWSRHTNRHYLTLLFLRNTKLLFLASLAPWPRDNVQKMRSIHFGWCFVQCSDSSAAQFLRRNCFADLFDHGNRRTSFTLSPDWRLPSPNPMELMRKSKQSGLKNSGINSFTSAGLVRTDLYLASIE